MKELDDDTTGGVDISVYEQPDVGKADFRRAAHVCMYVFMASSVVGLAHV